MNSTNLNPEFKHRLELLIQACADRGVIMKPYSLYRDPVEQGKLWRQSRPSWKVREKISFLRKRDAHFLADCLDRAGPTSGPHVTNAYGGLSWHNWGEAADCYWEINGRAVWDTEYLGDLNGYKIYAELAGRFGLTSMGQLYGWDWVHVQLRPETSPAKLFNILEVNDHLEDFYEGQNNLQLQLHFDEL